MEYLQYRYDENVCREYDKVLNLIINGIPSILNKVNNLVERMEVF